MSVKTIQRAYREGDIPVQWLRRIARFNLAQVQRAMARNGRSRILRLNNTASRQGATGGAAAGAHRRHAPVR